MKITAESPALRVADASVRLGGMDDIVVDATLLTPEERSRKGLRPPWKPGQSGNPKGRPRKRPLSDRYEALMESLLPKEIATAMKLPVGALWADAIAHVSARTALKHTEAGILQRKEIREAIEGKSTQRIEFLSDEQIDICVTFENPLGHKPVEFIDVQAESAVDQREESPDVVSGHNTEQ